MSTKAERKLKKEYNRLAKQADKQLRELEQLSKKKGYENIKDWSYNRAMKDIKSKSGSRKRSFKGVPLPDNVQQLKARINDVKTFLNSPTSSKAGIQKMFKDRADNLNENFGTNFTWQDLGNVFDHKEENVFYEKFGGKTYLKAVSYLKENQEDIMSDIYDISMGDKVIRTGNKKTDKAIAEIIDQYGIQFTDLY